MLCRSLCRRKVELPFHYSAGNGAGLAAQVIYQTQLADCADQLEMEIAVMLSWLLLRWL